MPINPPTIFAFGSCYANDVLITTPLPQILGIRTGGASLKEDFPQDFLLINEGFTIAGMHKISVTLSFISDDPTTTKLARGNPLAQNINYPPVPIRGGYSLLLVAPDPSLQQTYYFPSLQTESSYEVGYKKTETSTTSITFSAQSRDWSVQLFYKDSLQNIITYLGSKSPF